MSIKFSGVPSRPISIRLMEIALGIACGRDG